MSDVRAALQAAGVRVKPLEFIYGRAECDAGAYVIESGQAAGGGRWWAWALNPDETDPFFMWQHGEIAASEADAVEAVNQHNEARILAALEVGK